MFDKHSGTFVLVNATGSTISNTSLTHTCSDFTNVLTVDSLAVGQASSTKPLNSKSGFNDYWTVSFDINGETKTRNNKQCNMPNEDDLTCVIILYADDFSVITPDNSPCTHNHY